MNSTLTIGGWIILVALTMPNLAVRAGSGVSLHRTRPEPPSPAEIRLVHGKFPYVVVTLNYYSDRGSNVRLPGGLVSVQATSSIAGLDGSAIPPDQMLDSYPYDNIRNFVITSPGKLPLIVKVTYPDTVWLRINGRRISELVPGGDWSDLRYFELRLGGGQNTVALGTPDHE